MGHPSFYVAGHTFKLFRKLRGRIVAKDYGGDRDFKDIIRVIDHQLGAEKLLKAVKNKKKWRGYTFTYKRRY